MALLPLEALLIHLGGKIVAQSCSIRKTGSGPGFAPRPRPAAIVATADQIRSLVTESDLRTEDYVIFAGGLRRIRLPPSFLRGRLP